MRVEVSVATVLDSDNRFAPPAQLRVSQLGAKPWLGLGPRQVTGGNLVLLLTKMILTRETRQNIWELERLPCVSMLFL